MLVTTLFIKGIEIITWIIHDNVVWLKRIKIMWVLKVKVTINLLVKCILFLNGNGKILEKTKVLLQITKMKNIFNILFVLYFLQSCNNEKKPFIEKNILMEKKNVERYIAGITFFGYNTSVPVSFEFRKHKEVELTIDSAFFKEYTYKKNELIETKIISSIKLDEKQKLFFFTTLDNYAKNSEYSFSNSRNLNENIFKVIITLDNDEKVNWIINYNKKRLPLQIQPIKEHCIDIKRSLYKASNTNFN